MLERTLKRKSNRTVLDKTMTEMMGPQASWRIVAGTGRETGPVATEEPAEEADDVTSDPTVQTVLDLFGGQIESVETRGDAADR